MDRYDPLNAAEPGEAYRNADLDGGDMGSFPNALGFDATMTEIVAAIVALGGEPTNADWTQLGTLIAAALATKASTTSINDALALKLNLTGGELTNELKITAAALQTTLRHTDNTAAAVIEHLRLLRGSGAGARAALRSVRGATNAVGDVYLTFLSAADAVLQQYTFGADGKLVLPADPTAALGAATKQFVEATVANNLVPVGTTIFYNGVAAPTGYLIENGAAVSRTTYAALFALLGTAHGAGNGTTTFNLPESRGEFVRGLDSGRGVDTGRTLATAQADAFQGHWHDIQSGSNSGGSKAGPTGDSDNQNLTDTGGSVTATWNLTAATPVTNGANGVPRIASETRPRNVAKLICIKY